MKINECEKYVTVNELVVYIYKITDGNGLAAYGEFIDSGEKMKWYKDGTIFGNGKPHCFDIVSKYNQGSNSLDTIFDMQSDLNKRVISNFDEIIKDPDERRKWFFNMSLALTQEMAETTNELQFKWWKSGGEDKWDNVKKELVDEFHFFVSRCVIAGMNAGDLFNMYVDKNKINHERQNNEY
jgi:dimeric dUTPase (all-alpha-NTP-PPase superfamily)